MLETLLKLRLTDLQHQAPLVTHEDCCGSIIAATSNRSIMLAVPTFTMPSQKLPGQVRYDARLLATRKAVAPTDVFFLSD